MNRISAKAARIATTLVASAALAVGVVALNPTAAWAGTCDGAGCNGKDPQSTGCAAGAYTASTASTGGVLIELRYSPSCHANWARITPGPWGWVFHVHNANGNSQDAWSWGTSSAYSNMVNGYPLAQACFDNGVCTAWA